MQEEPYIRIPLHAKDGSVRAYALIDRADAHLAKLPWHLSQGKYAARSVWGGGRRIEYLHRAVMGLGPGDSQSVDHINRTATLDCRRANLRVGTHADNMQNRGSQANGNSQYRGVYWRKDRQKWAVQVKANGRKHCLGSFTDELEAARVASEFRAATMPFAVEEVI